MSTQLSIDHTSAQDTTEYIGIPGDFTNSHTDFGISVNAQRIFKNFIFGIQPKLVQRSDADWSRYKLKSGEIVEKDRSDWDLTLQPYLLIPLVPYLHLVTTYEWRNVSSNVTSEDYVDRNYQSHTITLGLRTFVSSY